MQYFVGWDVGAWHCKPTGSGSKDALAILDEKLTLIGLWEGCLSKAVLTAKDPRHFLSEVFNLCDVDVSHRVAQEDTYWLSIDTPLGWPTLFRDLLQATRTVEKPSENRTGPVDLRKGKINNPFLHRKTEVAIGQSLSAVQDQIGSQSTKALYLLHALSATQTAPGRWTTAAPAMTIVETYPAPCMRSLNFIDRVKTVEVGETITSDDMLDALICAALAFELDSRPDEIVHPCEGYDDGEGWIFVPNQHLPTSHGISYGRLVTSQSPPKPLDELLSQIQVGIVLKAAMKSTHCPDQWQSVRNWLSASKQTNPIFQSTTMESLRALFKLLNPKTKSPQYPADLLLQETAIRISQAFALPSQQP